MDPQQQNDRKNHREKIQEPPLKDAQLRNLRVMAEGGRSKVPDFRWIEVERQSENEQADEPMAQKRSEEIKGSGSSRI